MKKAIQNALKHRFLLKELVIKGIRLKYRRSYLGILWSLIEPLMTTAVLVVVFGTLLGKGDGSFPVYIIAARLMYSFFSGATKNAAKSVRKNAQMVKKVYVPKYLYPTSSVIFYFIIYIISLLALVAVMVFSRVAPTLYIWQIIPALILIFFITLGVSMILSVLMVFFRDVEYLWNVCTMMIMYMCAIFYPVEKIMESKWAFTLKLNPVYCAIDIFRGGVLGYMAESWDYMYAGVFAAAAMVIGIIFFKSKQDDFVMHL